MNAGNTIRQWRMNAELGTWEPAPAFGNVYHAKHVVLHDLGPNTERRLVYKVLLVSKDAN
jgi:hypothetical protein